MVMAAVWINSRSGVLSPDDRDVLEAHLAVFPALSIAVVLTICDAIC